MLIPKHGKYMLPTILGGRPMFWANVETLGGRTLWYSEVLHPTAERAAAAARRAVFELEATARRLG